MVSVVVPFYNAEAYLAEAIESVIAQSYAEWELLLVDDGSIDGGAAIVREFAGADRRIRYVRGWDANRGTSATRNVGLRLARGELVALLDSDDVWIREKLEEQVARLAATPEAGLLFGRTEYWHSWAGETAEHGDFVPDLGADEGVFEPPELLLRLYPLGAGNAPSLSSVVFRRSLLDSIGGFEEQISNPYEDQGFLAKAYLAAPVLLVDRVWDRYRQHDSSVSARVEQEGEYRRLRLEFLRWLRGYLDHHSPLDARVRRALDAALFLAGDAGSPSPPVTEVANIDIRPGPELSGANLELPVRGCLTVADLSVAGWVLARSASAALIRAEQGGRTVGEIPVDLTRADLVMSFPAAHASRPGFAGTIEGFALKPGTMHIRAVLEDGSVSDVATLRLR